MLKWQHLGVFVLGGCASMSSPESALPPPPPLLPPAANANSGSADDDLPRSAESGRPGVVFESESGTRVSVQVELAMTDWRRQRGLNRRRQLPAGTGMLFVYDVPQRLTFVMDQTYIPLDMIFINDHHQVVGVIENAEPLSNHEYEVDADAQYVLEVNAGFATQHEIGLGTRVRFMDVPAPEEAQ